MSSSGWGGPSLTGYAEALNKQVAPACPWSSAARWGCAREGADTTAEQDDKAQVGRMKYGVTRAAYPRLQEGNLRGSEIAQARGTKGGSPVDASAEKRGQSF